jgi:hypothetical protein
MNVKLSLCLIHKPLCNEDVWWSEGTAPPFLTSVMEMSGQLQVAAALPPNTYRIRGWVGHRVGLDTMENRKHV